jgi:hypothetical protein
VLLAQALAGMLGEANAKRAAPSTRTEPVELLQPVRAALRFGDGCPVALSSRDACVA